MNNRTINSAHNKALKLRARIEALEEQLETEKAVLTEAGTGKHDTPYGSFTVMENNVYDEDTITANLTKSQWKLCSVVKLSKAKVKVLFPNVYFAAKESRGFKVSL